MTAHLEVPQADAALLERVLVLALEAEAAGNLPIAALVTHNATIVAEAVNESRIPCFHPGRHAELLALNRVPPELWLHGAGRLTLFTSLEPCLMCFGAIVMHRVARVVYGSSDPLGGTLSLIPHLPPYVRSKAESVGWVGPAMPSIFDPLARRALVHAGSTSPLVPNPGAA